MIRRPPRSTLFPTRRSSDLLTVTPPALVRMSGRTVTPRLAKTSSASRSEEHTSELQSQFHLVCRLFFFNDTAPTEIHPFPYPTLFRSADGRAAGVGEDVGQDSDAALGEDVVGF